MQDKNTQHENIESTSGSVDERLATFYGPLRSPYQLPLASWHALQQRLGAQSPHRFPIRFRRSSLRLLPLSIQMAFRRTLREAYGPVFPRRMPELYVRSKLRLRQPTVKVSSLRPAIYLLLPLIGDIVEKQDALDTLLAVGLARYHLTQRWRYRWVYLLMLFLVLGDGATLMLASLYHQWVALLIAIFVTCTAVPLVYWQQRQRALQADVLAVRWFGRSRICRGLHALANYSHAPYRRWWSEPSLAERIEHVCGPRVEARDERLTMVH